MQTPEICMAAVRRNRWTLKYVEEQTLEVCMAAVKQEPRAIKCIHDPEMKKMVEETLQKEQASTLSIS